MILDSLNKYDSYYLERANDGFLFYGITPEVKIKKSSKSFFVINYNSQNQEAWETIGDVPVNKEKKISAGITGTFKPRIFDRVDFIEQKLLPVIDG